MAITTSHQKIVQFSTISSTKRTSSIGRMTLYFLLLNLNSFNPNQKMEDATEFIFNNDDVTDYSHSCIFLSST
jgi:hypothetical protein